MTYPLPATTEYAPYYQRYVETVPSGDILVTLRAQADAYRDLFQSVPDEQRLHRYAPDKWSLAESLLHVTDTERVFAYRALRIARGDTTPLPGFDENAYAALSGASVRSLADVLDELESVREASVTLFSGLPADAWTRRGTASGREVSVRGLAWITAGHLLHHLGVIQDRYL